MSGDAVRADGLVVDYSHNVATVEVTLGGKVRRVLATRAGRLKLHQIRVIPGDRVTVELGAYDLSRGRIVERLDDGRRARP